MTRHNIYNENPTTFVFIFVKIFTYAIVGLVFIVMFAFRKNKRR